MERLLVVAQLVALEGSQKQPSQVLGLGVVNPVLHMLRSKPQWGSSLGAALDALNRILGDAAAWLPPQIVLHLAAIETSQVRISGAIGNVGQVINGTFTLSNRVSNRVYNDLRMRMTMSFNPRHCDVIIHI